MLDGEAGGHRWQRVPPNEKRGRRHTSTVTVTVLDDSVRREFKVDNDSLTWKTTKGTGPGGQNRNKRENCVVLTHNPTGITVRVDSKSQSQNKQEALRIMTERLRSLSNESERQALNDARRQQVGSGMRGDKVRTIREQDGIVIDHSTGRKIPLKQYLAGELP